MLLEQVIPSLRAGKLIALPGNDPIDFNGIQELTPGQFSSADWYVYESPLSDEQLINAFRSKAAELEASADKRELERVAKWEEEVKKAEAEGKTGDELPTRPRPARSSIAATLRYAASALETRHLPADPQ